MKNYSKILKNFQEESLEEMEDDPQISNEQFTNIE